MEYTSFTAKVLERDVVYVASDLEDGGPSLKVYGISAELAQKVLSYLERGCPDLPEVRLNKDGSAPKRRGRKPKLQGIVVSANADQD